MTLKKHDGTWDSGKLSTIANLAIVLPVAGFVLIRGVAIYNLPDEQRDFQTTVERHFEKIESRQQVTDDKLNRLLQANGIAEWIATNQVGQIAERRHE